MIEISNRCLGYHEGVESHDFKYAGRFEDENRYWYSSLWKCECGLWVVVQAPQYSDTGMDKDDDNWHMAYSLNESMWFGLLSDECERVFSGYRIGTCSEVIMRKALA